MTICFYFYWKILWFQILCKKKILEAEKMFSKDNSKSLLIKNCPRISKPAWIIPFISMKWFWKFYVLRIQTNYKTQFFKTVLFRLFLKHYKISSRETHHNNKVFLYFSHFVFLYHHINHYLTVSCLLVSWRAWSKKIITTKFLIRTLLWSVNWSKRRPSISNPLKIYLTTNLKKNILTWTR